MLSTGAGDGALQPGLEGGAYTDPQVFAAERRDVFARSWVCVGRADEVPDAGEWVRVDVAGESILVVRGRDGRLRAVRNLCRHRGARICLAEKGSFDRAVVCPYHGWAYDLDGRLLATPNAADMPGLPKDELGLHPVRLEPWLGYVWLTLDPGAQPLAAQVDPQVVERLGSTQTLGRYGIDRLVVGHTVPYDVAANWKHVVENFMECYHCAAIHPELTAALPQFASGYGTISGGAGATFADGVESFTLSGRGGRPRLPGLLPSDDRVFHGVLLLPGVFVILVPDHVAVYRVEPVDAGRTRVVCDWLFAPDVATARGFDPADAVQLLHLTNLQDFEACERVQLGSASDAYRAVLVPAEHVVGRFHAWLAARAAG